MLRTRGVGGGLATMTPGRQWPLEDAGRGPQSCARLAAAVKRQKNKTGLTCFWEDPQTNTVFMFILMLMMMMMMMWWWWWWWWWWPEWNLSNPRLNFVTEWTSFTNLIQVCAVPRAGTRLYIHIYVYICIYTHIYVYMYMIQLSIHFLWLWLL